MANLGTFKIKSDEHVNVETATEETLTENQKYVIQSYDNPFYIRTGTEGVGTYVKPLEIVEYTHGEDDLYIKPIGGWATINIA